MPKPEIVDKALEQIRKRAVNYEYFFDHLNSPSWIDPLYEKGMFRNPPPPKKEGQYISYPVWPESQYLARMAALSPKNVLTILLTIPSTENIRIHEDIVEAASAACEKEPELTSKLVKKEADWISSQRFMLLMRPERISYLIKQLCRANIIDIALYLAKTLLAILPEPLRNEDDEIRAIRTLPEPRSRFDNWEYEHLLENLQPILLEHMGPRALTLFCELLEDAIRYSKNTEGEEEEIPEDLSFVWRPAIEDHSQNHSNDLKDTLVKVVRDTAEALIESEGVSVLSIVEGFHFKIFKRIGLHLRRKWIDIDLKGTSELLANPSIYKDLSLHHELFYLLHDCFDRFPTPVQKIYLQFIEKGEDQERWAAIDEKHTGKKPTQEDLKEHGRHWQYTKLFPIQEYLDSKQQSIFIKLKEEFGPLDHPDFLVYTSGGFTGPISPKNSEALRSMSVEEIISFIRSWNPPTNEFMGPSHEGLSRELTRSVSSLPDRFAIEAEKFEAVDPIYTGALLSGLRDAAQNGNIFTWQPVLQLCHWIVNQPQKVVGHEDKSRNAKSYQSWPLDDIADLLSAGFGSKNMQIPFELRALAWDTLKPITDDSEPTPEYETRYGGSNMNPATLSLNTTRGKAMHALVKYALWVRRNTAELSGSEVTTSKSFTIMPEVREILDLHLDPTCDPALSIRAIYGEYIPQLFYLDHEWTSQNVPIIFPTDEALTTFYDAAWEAYISFCHPYDDILDILLAEYKRAVQSLSITSTESSGLFRSDEHLAEHLMAFYWRGKLNLENGEDLITQFFMNASDTLRSHAMDFIGRSLCNSEDTVPVEILSRLQALWSWRLDTAKASATPSQFITELGGFGWWFISEKFDNGWALEQLKEALTLGAKIEPSHKVAERLAVLASSAPKIVIECLRLAVETGTERWHIYSWRDHAKDIILTALKSSDKEARRKATDFVNHLVTKGFLDFRDLIKVSDH